MGESWKSCESWKFSWGPGGRQGPQWVQGKALVRGPRGAKPPGSSWELVVLSACTALFQDYMIAKDWLIIMQRMQFSTTFTICRSRNVCFFNQIPHFSPFVSHSDSRAFFHCQGKRPMPYNFGENSVIFSLKGNEKTWCKVTFWGKLHDFKEIFWGEDAHKRPLLKNEKKPWIMIAMPISIC